MSFLHVEWVPLKQVEGEHLGKHRVKKFLQKYHQDGDVGEDFKENLKVKHKKRVFLSCIHTFFKKKKKKKKMDLIIDDG
jgi:hypothetical protein